MKFKKTPTAELAGFLAKYDPAVAAIARAALARLRKRLPGATEIVYDNYNALAVGFGPGEKTSEASSRVRHIVLKEADDIGFETIDALITAALAAAKRPIDAQAKRRLLIKSVSAKQRSRRPCAHARRSA
jgi:hypothetical protein